jgi:type I restriction enzyme R subunit
MENLHRNEADTRAELVEPALKTCGWGDRNMVPPPLILREYYISVGKLIGDGQRGKRRKWADFILKYKNQKLAIVEAKKEDAEPTQGLEQVKNYANLLGIRYVYSTNGHGIYFFDMKSGRGELVEKYHMPDELFALDFSGSSEMQIKTAIEASHIVRYPPRYYQENAINLAVDAISRGENRALLTLATGTGKTFIAFQIVWKLFQARWNKRGDERRPKILFLADRNVLVEQAMGDFNPLEAEIVRITGKEIRKAGKILTNGNIYFSIYQALTSDMTSVLEGRDEESETDVNEENVANPIFKQYPSDFFDLIIIDECHRGGATNDGNWREVLNHFSAATHLGLTATPKREDNADTYEYFGEPLYTYSLKDGIEDGFLTPFKLKSIKTDFDDYRFSAGDTIVSGEIDEDRDYTLSDFNRAIYLPEREKEMTKIMLENINPKQKTIIFCNDEKHALMIRDFVNELKTNDNPDYCVRITASEGVIGDEFLEKFRDNEKTIPTIVTTSRKLSTGVDSRNVRFIVLMRKVGSMTEFKQIIGRGTRVFDNKDYFTIVDFYGNEQKFDDPEWDGEPIRDVIGLDIEGGENPAIITEVIDEGGKGDDEVKDKNVVQLGNNRQVSYSLDTTFYIDGKPISSQDFLLRLYSQLSLFNTPNELREKWQHPKTRGQLLESLATNGFTQDKIEAVRELLGAKDSDFYDILRFVCFGDNLITRQDRVDTMDEDYLNGLNEKKADFARFVLDTYIKSGEDELSQENISRFIQLKYRTLPDATAKLGSAEKITENYVELQKQLYSA